MKCKKKIIIVVLFLVADREGGLLTLKTQAKILKILTMFQDFSHKERKIIGNCEIILRNVNVSLRL